MLRRSYALALAVLLAACGGKGTTAPGNSTPSSTSYLGTFTLKSVNLSLLPATILQQNNYNLLATDGQLTVNADFTYNMRINFRLTRNGTTTTPQWNASGTYSVMSLLGQPVLSFVDKADSNNNFQGTASGTTGSATVSPSVVVDPSGQPISILFAFGR